MQTVVIVIHLMVIVALVAVVLLQRSEGGALGMGGGDQFMTMRGQGNVLTRATTILGAIFFATSLAMSILNRLNAPPTAILDTTPAAQTTPTTPTAPATAPTTGNGGTSGSGDPGPAQQIHQRCTADGDAEECRARYLGSGGTHDDAAGDRHYAASGRHDAACGGYYTAGGRHHAACGGWHAAGSLRLADAQLAIAA